MRSIIRNNCNICELEKEHNWVLRNAWGKWFYECVNCGKTMSVENMRSKKVNFDERVEEVFEISFE